MNQDAKASKNPALIAQILSFGVLMTMEGMDLITNASLDNKLLTFEESKIPNVSTVKISRDKP